MLDDVFQGFKVVLNHGTFCVDGGFLLGHIGSLACHSHVPTFDVKATHVPHVLIPVPISFVCIHFAGGALSLLHHCLDVQD